MKKVCLLLTAFPLVFAAPGCTADIFTLTDEVIDTGKDEKLDISVSCAELNADIEALREILSALEEGASVTAVSDNGVTFSNGGTATVTVREKYAFDYINPVVGYSGACWTLDGQTLGPVDDPARIADEALKIKGEENLWYAYYGGAWNRLGEIVEGSSVPVFKAFSAGEDGSISITLSDDTTLSVEAYKGAESLVLSSTSYTFEKEGGSYSEITLLANADWTASVSDGEWLTMEPAAGTASDTPAPITIRAMANSGSSRTGKVTFTAGEVSAVITVSQKGESSETVLESADTETTDDNVGNTVFDRVISVVYGSGGATVTGCSDEFTVTVSGNDVTINNKGQDKAVYELSGSASDGFFKLYSTRKQAIILDGLNLTNPGGAAINNQSKKRTYIIVKGTNTLADGSVNSSGKYADEIDTEDMKAAFFSEGQLVFSGTGALTVTAKGKAGITSDDYVRFMSSPTVKVTSSAGHGIRGKDYIKVSSGIINASVSADMKKGFSSDSLVRIDGGVTTITVTGNAAYDSEDKDYSGSAGIKADYCFEMTGGDVTITNSGRGGKGIKVGSTPSVTITAKNYDTYAIGRSFITGGRLTIKTTGAKYSQGDISSKGIKTGWAIKSGHAYSYYSGDLDISGGVINVNSSSAEGIECKRHLTVTGGEICSVCTSDDAINCAGTFTIEDGYVCGISTGNDGLDSNGNFYIKGGVVYASGKTTPELGVDANTEGGFKLYVSGGTLFAIGGLENGASLTQTCYSASSWNKNSWYSLTVGSNTYAFKTPGSGGSGIVVSGASQPTLKSGVTVSGGTSIFGGLGNIGGVNGGTSVSLGTYSGGSGGPGGGGSGGGGGWGRP